MAFRFNDLGKKISGTAHSVVEQTKSSTDTVRLNSQIKEEENNINAAYLQIGQKYAEVHATDYEPAFAALFAQIVQSRAKIEEYREQVRKNKHLVICEGCGEEIAETVLYCTKCGTLNPTGQRLAQEREAAAAAEKQRREQEEAARQAAVAAAQVKAAQSAVASGEVCPKCGAARVDGAQFCVQCGTAFAPAPTAETVKTTASAEKICPQCGKSMPATNQFCTGCGAKLGD